MAGQAVALEAHGPERARFLGAGKQLGAEELAEIDRITAKVRIEDMYALSLRRDVKLEELTVDGLEAWVTFDAEGRSNFRNIKLPPPDPNQRILFAYSTAHVTVNDAVVHYDDRRYDISGEARSSLSVSACGSAESA